MRKRSFSKDPNYLQAIRGLHRLHSLTVTGKDQTAEADEVRDDLDQSWNRLSEVERNRLEGLSEDLYSLSDPQEPAKDMNPQATKNFAAVLEAGKNSDWDNALGLLRRWCRYIDPSLLSYMRGSIWQEAGDDSTATLFYGSAYDGDQNNGNYATLYLLSLTKSDAPAGIALAERIIRNDDAYPPALVIHAFPIFFNSAISDADKVDQEEIRHLVEVLHRNIDRLKTNDMSNDLAYVSAITFLGLCYDRLGDYQNAIQRYDQVLADRPDLNDLYFSRGMLRYSRDPKASEDFKEAIRRNSGSYWPYVYLAHSTLLDRSFKECLELCTRALHLMEESSPMITELHEWSAICMAELGYPAERVKYEFNEAIRLSPKPATAKNNFSLFLKQQKESQVHWSTPSKQELRDVVGVEPLRRPFAA